MLWKFSRISDNGQLAIGDSGDAARKEQSFFRAFFGSDSSDFRLQGEDGIRMTRENADQAIRNSQYDLVGLTFPGDLFWIDDGGGKTHLALSSLSF